MGHITEVFALDTSEIRDNEINVEEIMLKIRENIKRRKEKGTYPDEEPQILSESQEQVSLCQPAEQAVDEKKNDLLAWADEIKRDLDYINNNWDIQNNSYFISSHRPYSGKFLTKGRELVHGEVKRYVDPMICRQKEFNVSVARTLNETTKKISEISQMMTSARASVMIVNETTRRISEISQKTIELESESLGKIRSEMGSKVKEQIRLVKTEMGSKVEEQIRLVKNEMGSKVEEQIRLAKTEMGSKVEEQIRLAKTEMGSKVEEQIGLAKTEMGSKVEEQIRLAKTEMGSKVEEQIGLVRSEINNEISAQVRSIVASMNQEIENKAWLANILDRKIDSHQNIEASVPTQESGLNYFIFEERFRGSRKDIKQRQTNFVHYFEGCKNILDIGCGRGEFLELLRDQGIDGKGIDVDEDMVNFCKSKGLDVVLIDAISYLETVEDKSLDGIFIDQVVEHLEPNYLIKMIGLCHKKLIYGGSLIAETVNPLSFASFANFYIDLSHKRPMHPETLRFILESVGFREMEMKFLAPVPEEVRLSMIDVEHSNEKDKRIIDTYNHNINMINNVLFGAQDYAIIGRK
ncbi:MAG: hypothetical protein QG575_148 [Euryarchaeota archaeon]|nr:hypothetical protein [Euryarchaeota archaeon]